MEKCRLARAPPLNNACHMGKIWKFLAGFTCDWKPKAQSRARVIYGCRRCEIGYRLRAINTAIFRQGAINRRALTAKIVSSVLLFLCILYNIIVLSSYACNNQLSQSILILLDKKLSIRFCGLLYSITLTPTPRMLHKRNNVGFIFS